MLISLFCGPGGMDEGFGQTGFTTQLAYDIDHACVETFHVNNPLSAVHQRDLSSLNAEEIIEDWNAVSPGIAPVGLIGGPPCQSFSISNAYQKDDDPRHELPVHYARILEELNNAFGLSFFVFENAPGLASKKYRARFEHFKTLFAAAGFRVKEAILDAQNFGVPQVRPRVFVVGTNTDIYPNIEFDFDGLQNTALQAPTVRQALGQLPEPTYFRRGLAAGNIPHHPNHWCMVPRSPKFGTNMLRPGKLLGRSFRVLDWDAPSYTVAYGHREVHIHPSTTRRLSVYEAMILQGFPHTYELIGTLSDQIRLVSEAVAPPVAHAIAQALIEQLDLHIGEAGNH